MNQKKILYSIILIWMSFFFTQKDIEIEIITTNDIHGAIPPQKACPRTIMFLTFKSLTAYSTAELTPFKSFFLKYGGTKFATFLTTNNSPIFVLNKIAGSTLESEQAITIVLGCCPFSTRLS